MSDKKYINKNSFESEIFIKALCNHDLNVLRNIPKTDLHNHFVLGETENIFIKKQISVLSRFTAL